MARPLLVRSRVSFEGEGSGAAPLAVIAVDFAIWTAGALASTALVFGAGVEWLGAGLAGWWLTCVGSRRAAWRIARRAGWAPATPGRPR